MDSKKTKMKGRKCKMNFFDLLVAAEIQYARPMILHQDKKRRRK